MRITALIIVILISITTSSQIPDGFPCLDKDNIENGKVKTERTYTRESLFGYMNGGAELYLEYGFDRLVVSEIIINDTEYKIEVYRMEDPEAAYGIYSVSVFRCDKSDQINDYSCQSDYQLQVCKNRYYISIINNTGSSEAAELSVTLAQKLQPLIRGNSFKISDFIADLQVEQDIIKATLIKGELGLFNGASDWYYLLQGVERYTGLVLDRHDNSDIILEFTDNLSLAQFLEKLGISPRPEINQEVNIDQNTILAVKSDRVVVIHR